MFRPRIRLMGNHGPQFRAKADLPVGFPYRFNSSYLFQCNLYTNQRLRLFHSLLSYVPLTVELLLFGDLNMSVDDNELIALCIQKYIHETKRF